MVLCHNKSIQNSGFVQGHVVHHSLRLTLYHLFLEGILNCNSHIILTDFILELNAKEPTLSVTP
jgi:hypothetical protein